MYNFYKLTQAIKVEEGTLVIREHFKSVMRL